MSTTFQTIPTMDPTESAFVLTVDDHLIRPDTLPVLYTKYRDWVLYQKERTYDTEWDDYVFMDTETAAPGRRSFIFGKDKSETEADVPFESYHDTEFYRWPTVITQILKTRVVSSGGFASFGLTDRFLIKSAAEVNSMILVEHFQNARPYGVDKLRHPQPITDDLTMMNPAINDCLHSEIAMSERPNGNDQLEVVISQPTSGLGYTIPATNFTDWPVFVLRDGQKQQNGSWVREKVTIFPPINAKRRFLS